MLKYKLASLDEVEEQLQGLYTEQDGSFVLQIEGVKTEEEISGLTSALQKERQNAKEAQRKLQGYGERTPEDFNVLSDRVAELNATSAKDVDALIKARMLPFEREKEKLAQERDEAMTAYSKLKESGLNSKRDAEIAEMAAGKIKSEFIRDAKLRAKYELQYNEDVQGFVSADGLNATDWFAKQITETPSWEFDSKGGGAKGGSGPTKTVTDNPWITGSYADQVTIFKQNPELAQSMKAAAGK